jgi:hypothetical protein
MSQEKYKTYNKKMEGLPPGTNFFKDDFPTYPKSRKEDPGKIGDRLGQDARKTFKTDFEHKGGVDLKNEGGFTQYEGTMQGGGQAMKKIVPSTVMEKGEVLPNRKNY